MCNFVTYLRYIFGVPRSCSCIAPFHAPRVRDGSKTLQVTLKITGDAADHAPPLDPQGNAGPPTKLRG